MSAYYTEPAIKPTYVWIASTVSFGLVGGARIFDSRLHQGAPRDPNGLALRCTHKSRGGPNGPPRLSFATRNL